LKFVTEYRDPGQVDYWRRQIAAIAHGQWRIMEVCGGQTHSIVKHGLDQLLPDNIELIHGPGCPVCVTPIQYIDKALAIAAQPDVVFCSFGDMLRVPGSTLDLLGSKAQGADVRIVYSPLDALAMAQHNPDKQIVFFGVGFETTAPTTALAAYQARRLNLKNFSLLIGHVRVPPVIEALLAADDCRVQGFLGAGHVAAVMGCREYQPIAEHYRLPIVMTGFEPVDILQGLYLCIRQLEQGRYGVENQYRRVVTENGNQVAQALIRQVFVEVDRPWRGLGDIAASGWALQPDFDDWNAEHRFDVAAITSQEAPNCRSGEVLQGRIKPQQCPAFATLCTPERPLGATMVSSEGACAAYYRYRSHG